MYQILKNEADGFRKAKKYEEALVGYAAIWGKHAIECNQWDGWGYAFCLWRTKRLEEALAVCRVVYQKYPTFENIKNVYAWCIYQMQINVAEVKDEALFLKAAEGIIRLTVQEDISDIESKKPCLYAMTVCKVLDYYDKRNTYHPELVLKWVKLLRPDWLPLDVFAMTDKNNKRIEIASKKEQYYMHITKAYLENREYDLCIERCTEALQLFEKLHYGNEVWFARRISLSLLNQNKKEEALALMLKLLQKKKEWFIQKEVAELYVALGQADKALPYALDACLNFGEINMKINSITLLADLLPKATHATEIKLSLQLVVAIKSSMQWKMDAHLQAKIVEWKLNTEELNVRKLENEFRTMCKTMREKDKISYTGVVKAILPNGLSGFIEGAGKKSYYFVFKHFKGRKEDIKQGLKVQFEIENGFDTRKNKPSEVAINIVNC